MRKTRFVNGIDFGKVRSDGKYRQVLSGYNATSLPTPTELKNGHLAQAALSTKKYSTHVYVEQNEVFESSTRKRPLFNNCRHTLVKTQSLPFSISFMLTPTRVNTHYVWRIQSKAHSLLQAVPIDWGAVSSNMQAEAYHTMIPRFEGDVSMINFIFEMKDFRDISFAAFKNIPKIVGNPSIMDSMHAVTKRGAEVHLIKTFAVDPLIDDTASIIMQAQSLVMDVQQKFAAKGLTTDARHFSKPLYQSQSLGANVTGSSDYWTVRSGTKYAQKFTATMEGDYGYRCRSDLEAFLQYWGLNFTAEAVWNAIPFSFLADYFISIGHSLNVMRHDRNVSYNVRQYCESILSTAQSGWFIGGSTSLPADILYIIDDKVFDVVSKENPRVELVTGTTSSYYERVVKQPYWGPYLPKWKIPNEKQFLNMAALLRCLL